MKFKIPATIEIDVVYVRITVSVDDDDMPCDTIGRSGNLWQVTVHIETGVVQGWPIGTSLDVCIKARDSGTYELLNADGRPLLTLEQDYVPHGVVPGNYGDYVEMNISVDGRVTNWPKSISIDEFIPRDE